MMLVSRLQLLCPLLLLALVGAQPTTSSPSTRPSAAPKTPASSPVAAPVATPVATPVASPVAAPTGAAPAANPAATKPTAKPPTKKPTRSPSATKAPSASRFPPKQKKCLKRIKERCSCGLFLRGQDACPLDVLDNVCKEPNRKLIRTAYRRYCRKNCREYARSFFVFSRAPVYICAPGV